MLTDGRENSTDLEVILEADSRLQVSRGKVLQVV
jgi:hypothetical protein